MELSEQESFFENPDPAEPAPLAGAAARPSQRPARGDPEQLFFRAAASYLWWTWRLVHRAGAPFGTAQVEERRHDRAETLAMLVEDLRSYKRMQKDPNEYRAVFRYQKQPAHHLKIRVEATIEIKIFQATRDRWEAWYYDSAVRRATQPLRATGGQCLNAATRESLESAVYSEFEEQVTDWRAYNPATGQMLEKPMEPVEVQRRRTI